MKSNNKKTMAIPTDKIPSRGTPKENRYYPFESGKPRSVITINTLKVPFKEGLEESFNKSLCIPLSIAMRTIANKYIEAAYRESLSKPEIRVVTKNAGDTVNLEVHSRMEYIAPETKSMEEKDIAAAGLCFLKKNDVSNSFHGCVIDAFNLLYRSALKANNSQTLQLTSEISSLNLAE